MRVLIIEPHATGHHGSYLRWLVQEAHRRQWDVVIATTDDALSHPALTTIESSFPDVEIHRILGSSLFFRMTARSSWSIRRELGYWGMFRRIVKEIQARKPIDFIILPYIDYCFYLLALLGAPFGDISWCGISMRLAVTFPQANASAQLSWKWRMAKRLLASSSLRALFVINPSVSEVPAHWYSARELSRLRYLPDPAECAIVDARSEYREILGVAGDGVAILVFGSIDERKGIDSLIIALSSQDALQKYSVILAGQLSITIKDQLSSPEYARLIALRRLIVLDRFVSTTEVGFLLAASDIVWVGYRNHFYMSGVLVLAGKAGLPVIGTVDGEIGRLITKHAMGLVARVNRPTEVALAMRMLLSPDLRQQMGSRAKIAFENHTVDEFGTRVMASFDS